MSEEEMAAPQEIDFADVPLETPRIHLITGRPGQGKTVLDLSIADRLHAETGKEVYVVMTERDKAIEEYEGIPEYIHTLRGIDFPLDSIVVGDDWLNAQDARQAVPPAKRYEDIEVWPTSMCLSTRCSRRTGMITLISSLTHKRLRVLTATTF